MTERILDNLMFQNHEGVREYWKAIVAQPYIPSKKGRPNQAPRKQLSIALPEQVHDRFIKYCDDRRVGRAFVVETLIIDLLCKADPNMNKLIEELSSL